MDQRLDLRRIVRFLPWAALVVCSVSPPVTHLRAESIVIPAGYLETEGPGETGTGGQNFWWRQQWLYFNHEFPSGPIDITGFRLRPKAFTGSYSLVYQDTQISLTTTTESGLALNFDANLEAALQSPTIVLDGDIQLQTTRERPPLIPRNFDYEFLWETPFRYDPSDGVNLVIETESRGGYSSASHLDSARNVPFRHEGKFLSRHVVDWEGSSIQHWTAFPITEFIYTPVLPPPVGSGDFNADGVLDAADIDALTAAVRGGIHPAEFDLNSDNVVDESDREFWVNESKRTYFGDANLDGEFNSGDLIAVFQAGQYEDAVAGNSTWSTGDWDGDGEFASADLIAAFSDGAYEAGPRTSVSAVPEPASRVILLVGFIGIAIRRRYLGP